MFNVGWVHGQMGRNEAALAYLRQGRELARERGEELLIGHFLHSEADVLIDASSVPEAIELARKAVAIAARTGNVHMSREANATLALAFLCKGDVDAACAAADAAARQPRSARDLGAFILQGITAFRRGEREKAHVAFLKAYLQAEKLIERESQNFSVLDAHGLILCGLAMCGEEEQVDRAILAYKSARDVTEERGTIRRSLLLLTQLCYGWVPKTLDLEAVRRTASGN